MKIDDEKLVSRPYLFILTFFAVYSLFPVMTDYFLQTYGSDFSLLTPLPSNIFGTVFYLIITLLLAFVIFKISTKRKKDEELRNVSIHILKFSLVFSMVIFYGYAKVVTKQFQINYGSLETPLKDVSSMHLAWYFFGRSNIQTFLLGLVEIIPALMLLHKRTSFIGALILVPVLANVVLVNIFNDIQPHTLLFSTIFLIFDLAILYSYKADIKLFLSTIQNKFASKTSKSKIIIKSLNILIIALIIIKFCYGIFNATKVRTELSKVKSKCFGIYQITNLSFDDKPQDLDSLSNYWKKLYFEKKEHWNEYLVNKSDEKIPSHYFYFTNKDSIKIISYNSFNEKMKPTDSTVFKGTYVLTNNDSTLVLKGIYDNKLFHSTYKKLPIDGHDWWW